MAKSKFYAVRVGKNIGIYSTWNECKEQVHGFKGAVYKSFENIDDARNFIFMDTCDRKTSNVDAIFYVDGSFNVKTNEFSYGVVLLVDEEEKYFNDSFSDEELASMRNVAGEIFGARFAMEYAVANDYKDIEIYFDYEGIEKWAVGLWKTNKNGTVEYKKYYDSIKDILNVKFIKVKGHSGDKYNDLADRLAKDAIGIK